MKIIFKSGMKEIITSFTKKELEQWYDEKYCLAAVEQDGYALRYVKEQTEAICLKAVEQDGDALRYVKEQTEAICLKAVEQDGDAIKYIDIHADFLMIE